MLKRKSVLTFTIVCCFAFVSVITFVSCGGGESTATDADTTTAMPEATPVTPDTSTMRMGDTSILDTADPRGVKSPI